MSAPYDDACLTPLLDTWRPFDGAASWLFTPRIKPASPAAVDLTPWAAAQLAALLGGLREITRVREARLDRPPDGSPHSHPHLRWNPNMASSQDFERQLLEAVRGAPGPVTSIEVVFDLHAYVRTALAHEPREQFRVLFLDKRNQLIADEIQQTGTVDHTPVYVREVVKRALELAASAIVLVHNHPTH